MASIHLAIHYCPESADHLIAWQQGLSDSELKRAVLQVADDLPPETILALGTRLPFLLSATNDGWSRLSGPQVAEVLPSLLHADRITPLLAHGYGLHAAFLSPEELAVELAINDSYLRRAGGQGVVARGAYAEALCFDAALGPVYREAGVSWIIAAAGEREHPFTAGGVTVVPPAITGLEYDPEPDTRNDSRENPVLAHFEVRNQADWARVEEFVALSIELGHSFVGGAEVRWEPQARIDGQVRFGFYPRRQDLVRADGVYRTLSHSVEGPDAYQPASLYERRPFVLWERGLPLVHLTRFLFAAFARSFERGNGSDAPTAIRYLEGAHRWGTDQAPGEEKRIALPIVELAREFHRQLHDGFTPRPSRRFEPGTMQALRASLSFQIDNRLNALEFGLQEFAGSAQVAHARPWIVEAREHRLRAAETLNRLDVAMQAIALTPGAWYRVVDMFSAYGHELFSAADALEQVARLAGEVPGVAPFVEEYLARIWPPQAAVMLDRFFSSIVRINMYGEVRPETPGQHAEGSP